MMAVLTRRYETLMIPTDGDVALLETLPIDPSPRSPNETQAFVLHGSARRPSGMYSALGDSGAPQATPSAPQKDTNRSPEATTAVKQSTNGAAAPRRAKASGTVIQKAGSKCLVELSDGTRHWFDIEQLAPRGQPTKARVAPPRAASTVANEAQVVDPGFFY